MRKQLHVVALGVVVVVLGACNALVGQYVDAVATVWVVGRDRVPHKVEVTLYTRQQLDVGGTRTDPRTGSYQEKAVVRVVRCPGYKCGSHTPFVRSVVARVATTKQTEAYYDDSDAKKIGLWIPGWGKGLRVTWHDRPQGVADGPPAPADGPAVESEGVVTTTATVTFLGVTCTDRKAVVTRHTTVSPLGITQPAGKAPTFDVPDWMPDRPKCTTGR